MAALLPTLDICPGCSNCDAGDSGRRGFAHKVAGMPTPALVKAGWTRHQEGWREASLHGADGAVRSTTD